MPAPFGKADAKIEGGEYTLVFNFGAMAAIEQKFDVSFQALARELEPNEDGSPKDFKLSTAAMLLWGCFRAKHPHVGFEQAGEMLMGDDAEAAVEAVLSCISSAFPDGEKEKNPPKRAKAGSGKNS